MPRPARRTVEVETLADFDRLVAAGARSMGEWRLQDLDLTDRGEVLRRLDPRRALFLGCRVDPSVAEDLRTRGALVFPEVPDVPVDPYRARLYTPDELYDGLATGSYADTVDARAYAWALESGGDVRDLLVQSLHDLAVDDALTS
jgi:hypothetical protein